MTTQARPSQARPITLPPTGPIRGLSMWSAAVGALGVAGFAVFFASLRHIPLGRMNGLGLLSVLPPGAIAGVTILALACILGLALPRAHPVGLGAALAGLVVCLDGVTAFIEPEPRFPTTYQIAGFVRLHQHHWPRDARAGRVLQLAGPLRAGLDGRRGGRNARPAGPDADLADADRPALPAAVLPDDA